MTSPYIVLTGLGVAVIPCSGHVQRTSGHLLLSLLHWGLGVAVIPCSGHVQRTSGQPGGSVSECRSLVVIAGVFCCTECPFCI